MKLLIADDNLMMRKRVEAAVARWGCEPVVVADGLAAWKALRFESSPRLAILDWNMPGIPGTEVCRRVRQCGKESYTYMILLTSNSEQRCIVEGLKAGADDFVRKPFDAAELEQRIRTGRRIIELQDRLLAAQEHLRLLATRDALTGLWNRREILQFLDDALSRLSPGAPPSPLASPAPTDAASAETEPSPSLDARTARGSSPVGALLIDIDHFKSINDTFGHLEGDQVLRRVASTITAELRAADRAGRYWGEEFLVVLQNSGRQTTLRIAERIRRRVERTVHPIQTAGRTVTVSIGVACVAPPVIQTSSEMIQQCDDALYAAKRSGRNRVCAAPQEKMSGSSDHTPTPN